LPAPFLCGRALGDGDHGVRKASIQALAGGWRHEAVTLQLLRDRAANDDHPTVRQAAMVALAAWWHDPATADLLRDRTARDENPDVRRAAAGALAGVELLDSLELGAEWARRHKDP
jgi:HEAT repeat protein